MSQDVTGTLTLVVEVEVQGAFQPGYPATGPSYSSGGEPGTDDMIEDGEVTGLWIERQARTRYGTRAYEPENVGAGIKPYTKPLYERVDLLAELDPVTKAAVLRALSNALCHEIEEQLLSDAEDL